jgi:hypothetical protein
MATVNLGRIKFVWQGAYSGATAYVADDVVSYNGSSYICILASTGNLPTNATYWSLMAQSGTDIASLAGLAQGDVLYYNGTSWVRLGAGTSGQFLKTNGAGANPSWNTLNEYNDAFIRNDLATLAIRQATLENKGAYNTNSMYVDVFQDSTGIGTETNAFRSSSEYLSTASYLGGLQSDSFFMVDGASSLNDTVNSVSGITNDISGTSGTPTTTSSNQKWSGYNTVETNAGTIKYDGLENYWNGSGAYTVDFWQRLNANAGGRERYWSWDNSSYQVLQTYGTDYGSSADFNSYAHNGTAGFEYPVSGTFNHPNTNRDWNHFRYVRDGSNNHYYYFNGTRIGSRTQSDFGSDSSTISNNDFRISGRRTGASAGGEFFQAQYTDFIITPRALSTGASFSVPTEKARLTLSASGSVENNAITAPSSISKMGAIISYQNYSGTNALNTDIVLQLSANNGSNYTTATLEALPNYSSTIRMAKVNNLTVTAGTQLKYKVNFANQSNGSKEARILGVSLMY